MKPPPFSYVDPDTLDAALAVLAEHGDDATVLAGGQSLIPLLNLRLARPEVVLDLRRVASLGDWSADDGCLRAGAMVPIAVLERSAAVAAEHPGLHRSFGWIAHSQIRARTTVGGSLAHADPAAELPAALVALEGRVQLISAARGARDVAAAEFFLGPFSTARLSDELVTMAQFPKLEARSTVVEVARRPGDFAIAGAFVALGSTIARIVVFGVHDRPFRVREAEDAALSGASPADVAAIVRGAVSPQADTHASAAYRRHLAGTVVARALEELT